MGWRSVVISRPAHLRLEHSSLAIDQDNTAHVSFEDIAVIILDNREITIAHPVLSACAEYGISLYATGDNHLPSGVFLSFLSHSRTTRMMRKQLCITRPTAKRAHGDIVRRKIENQAVCLRLCSKKGAEKLETCARRVRSGDPDNMEGQAAALYFAQLYGADFSRNNKISWTNAALNYGYAILRGAIARGLVAHGLHPTIGLFHNSELNAFNLADDLIEPFRPLVDLYVAKHPTNMTINLLPEDKQALIALLNVDIGMSKGKMSVLSAIEHAVESLVRIYESANSELDLPYLIGLQAHKIE